MHHPPNPEEFNHKPTYHIPAAPYAEMGIASFGWMVRASFIVSLMFTAATPVVGLIVALNFLFRFKPTVIFLISYPADSVLWLTFLGLCIISSRLMIHHILSTKNPLYVERCDYLAQVWFIAFGLHVLVLIYIAISNYS